MSIGPNGENLILLISQQRAGSTLLQRILAGHPDVHTTAETWLMLHPIYALREEGHQAEYNARLAFTALQDWLGTLEGGEAHYIEALRRQAVYLYDTACQQAGKARFLDKTPRYDFVIPELARIFPAAHFVILLRNPLAVLASILDTWVKGHWVLLPRYRSDLLDAPRRLVAGIELLGARAHVLHYEHLVTGPEAQVEALCRYLDLDFFPSMLEYGRQEPHPGHMGDPTGVHQHSRPTTASLERWLELGREQQTRHFAAGYLDSLGGDLLAAMGYDYDELERKLAAVPCAGGRVELPWQQVVEPTPAFRRRLYYVELALLEHRRLAHALGKWRKSRKRRRR
ncbi:MAG: sulfotransferase [Anaerolineae bacterium]|nr:sulfotransferase [Anaerolineae bacterium]